MPCACSPCQAAWAPGAQGGTAESQAGHVADSVVSHQCRAGEAWRGTSCRARLHGWACLGAAGRVLGCLKHSMKCPKGPCWSFSDCSPLSSFSLTGTTKLSRDVFPLPGLSWLCHLFWSQMVSRECMYAHVCPGFPHSLLHRNEL